MTSRLVLASAVWLAAFGAATLPARAAAPATVTGLIDERQTVMLTGNTRSEARPANDRGALAAGYRLDHMQLLLKRPAGTEAALVAFMASQYDRRSPNFHRWLTAAQFGETYGPATTDIAAVKGWLTAHGMTVNGVATGRMTIDFSGTAGSVASAFGTAMHRLEVNGASHISNMTDPRIPAALAGVVAGVTSLNDFRPHTNITHVAPSYTSSSGYYLVVPADLATIYNFNPAFAAGLTGAGQTVVVIEDTEVYRTSDWTTFRSKLGLSGYTDGSFTQVFPAGSSNCSNPGVVSGNEGEAELDAEWASAAAPSAAIVLAACSDTSTVFGGLIALQNLLESSNPPAIVSISYGECEAENGATANAAFNSTYQQAAALGVSVFVSSGDEGAASCDANQGNATHGINVSGFASSPYDVAVGGTDFADTYQGKNAIYWSHSNHGAYGSAKSYIPEIPWNDSCASTLLATAYGYSVTYGSGSFCNSSVARSDGYLTTASGSGGPSGCATGSPTTGGVVSGTCQPYAKPSWQAVFGNPADGKRDIPDISLFSANGVWAHYYAYCDSDVFDGGASCNGAPDTWSGAGGTSFASPIMAGVQALVNQSQGAAQGNPNPVLYALAATSYGASGNPGCSSSKGKNAGASCVFYDVNFGDMDVNCTGTHGCYLPSGNYGVLSTGDAAYKKAYGAKAGWDFATGIGTVNVTNLIANW